MTDKPAPVLQPIAAAQWQLLADWLRAAEIDCLEITSPGHAFRLVRGAQGYRAEALDPGLPASGAGFRSPAVGVTAPCAGVFLDRYPLDVESLVQAGERVHAGGRVGFIQIGLLLVPVVAPTSGMVGHLAVSPGTLVGYGARLIDIDEDHA